MEEATAHIMRTGIGMDVHAFASPEEGRALMIGGVHVPYERGLAGHSDADVLAHAVADALLGAARIGDIGKLFPDTDPAYEGADSMVLLAAAAEAVRDAGFAIVDVDSVVAAQAPKLSPYRDEMRANLARAMGISVENVGVKATTTEHLGFEGRGEGITAYATCLLSSSFRAELIDMLFKYRAVMGQPNQEELIERIRKALEEHSEEGVSLEELFLNLCPFCHEKE